MTVTILDFIPKTEMIEKVDDQQIKSISDCQGVIIVNKLITDHKIISKYSYCDGKNYFLIQHLPNGKYLNVNCCFKTIDELEYFEVDFVTYKIPLPEHLKRYLEES